MVEGKRLHMGQRHMQQCGMRRPLGGAAVGGGERLHVEQRHMQYCSKIWPLGGAAVGEGERLPRVVSAFSDFAINLPSQPLALAALRMCCCGREVLLWRLAQSELPRASSPARSLPASVENAALFEVPALGS